MDLNGNLVVPFVARQAIVASKAPIHDLIAWAVVVDIVE
jgi:hypothetical protein